MTYWIVLGMVLLAAGMARAGEDPMAGAAQRIEQVRKGDVTLTVVDPAGHPVPGVAIKVEQATSAFRFGCNLYCWGDEADRYRKGLPADQQDEYRRRFADLFNFATLPFYWKYYEPTPGHPRHAYMEQLARWCRENGIEPKGHPLAYNFFEPPWLEGDAAALRKLQRDRVSDWTTHFAGQIQTWDVFNELTKPSVQAGNAPKLTAALLEPDKIAFARQCFLAARKANPKATLLINDYRTDNDYADVIRQLVDDAGKPLYDVIGIQSHMHKQVWSNQKIWETCDRFAAFNVPLHFTEVTILSGPLRAGEDNAPWPSTPEGEAGQAADAVRLYTLLFSHQAVQAITWWDMVDGYTWRGAPAGLLRQDLSPKPAYAALQQLIRTSWRTHTQLTSNDQGVAAFHGFHGGYHLTAALAGREVGQGDFSLHPGTPGEWRLTVNVR